MLRRSGGSRHITMQNFVEISPSKHSKNIVIFRFSKWPLLLFWIFEIAKFYWLTGSRGSRRISVPNIVNICPSVAKMLRLFDFSRRWPSAILDLFGAYLDHTQWAVGFSITLQNLVIIDAVVFIIWTFQYLAYLAGKRLFTPLRLGLWAFDPLNGLQYYPTPKRHALSWVRVIWAIKRQNMVSGLTCRWVASKRGKKIKKA